MQKLTVLLSVACFIIVVSATCTTTANTDYTSTGNLLTLYGVTSAAACCTACTGFAECKYCSWTSSNSQCYPKSKQSSAVTTSGITGGVNSATYNRTTSCTSDVGYEYYYSAGTLSTLSASSASACCTACSQYVGCNYYKYSGGTCYLQAAEGTRRASSSFTSGTVIPSYSSVAARTGSRGLGVYGTSSCSDISLLKNVSWVYNWDTAPGVLEQCYNSLGIEFVPMWWSPSHSIGDLYTKSKYVLGFNEPNFSAQSALTPAAAAAAWPTLQNFAKTYGMKIGSPSASYGGDLYDPIQWLQQFLGNCSGCQVDFIATHQYDCNAVSLHGAISNFRQFNKPIWVTEFGCLSASSSTVVQTWLSQLLVLFDADTTIQRYAYFGSRANANYVVFDPTKAALSATGSTYAGSN